MEHNVPQRYQRMARTSVQYGARGSIRTHSHTLLRFTPRLRIVDTRNCVVAERAAKRKALVLPTSSPALVRICVLSRTDTQVWIPYIGAASRS